MPSNFTPLFDGKSLAGWHAVPRYPVSNRPGGTPPVLDEAQRAKILSHKGRWSVEDGAICGRQEPAGSGLGAYLLSDGRYADFELVFEARPDWPTDTGVLLRATDIGSQGYQVLIDHRRSGNIGGLYGNGIGGFHAINFTIDAARDEQGRPIGLREEDASTTIEPLTPAKRSLLTAAATGDTFLKAWHWDDWNEFHVTIRGEVPTITTRINGEPIAEADARAFPSDLFDPAAVVRLLGPAGRIALEVHDNDPGVGEERWGRGAAARWRNIRIREF